MTEGESPQTSLGDKLAQSARRAGRFALRLAAVLLLGVVLGVAAYYGVPATYRSIVEPVRLNTSRLAELEGQIATLEAGDRAAQLVDLQGRLSDQAKALTEIQATLASLRQSWGDQGDKAAELDRLSAQAQALDARLTALAGRVQALETSVPTPVAAAPGEARQLLLLRAMLMLTRARLGLTQDNAALTAEAVRDARQAVVSASEGASGALASTLASVIQRLDLVLKDLNTSMAAAADDLEVAWVMLATATAP